MDLRDLQQFEIRELVYFVGLAEELHFARAAERLGIHQSPLSKTITLMERRLGVRLFVRTRRRTRLTEAGAAVLVDARRVLAEVDRTRHNISALASGRKGRVRIGICDGFVVPHIARLLEESSRDDPQVEFSLERRSLAEQIRGLRLDLLDIGLAPSPAPDPAEIDFDVHSIAVRKDPVVVAMRPDHLLAKQDTLRSLEASAGPFILVGERSIGSGSIGKLIEPPGSEPKAVCNAGERVAASGRQHVREITCATENRATDRGLEDFKRTAGPVGRSFTGIHEPCHDQGFAGEFATC